MEKNDVNLELLRSNKISSSTICDILDSMGLDCAITPKLSRISGSKNRVVGRALTVEWGLVKKRNNICEPQESTWAMIKNFLLPGVKDGNNRIYVAGAGSLLSDAALAGGISSTYFDAIGFEALILGGGIRDYDDVAILNLPIVASGWTPSDTQGFFRVRSVGTSCKIESITINSGDLIISDLTGTIIIPQGIEGKVLRMALNIESAEKNLIQLAKKGICPLDMIEEYGRI